MSDKQDFETILRKNVTNVKGWGFRYVDGLNDSYEKRLTGDYEVYMTHADYEPILIKKGRTVDHFQNKKALYKKYFRWSIEFAKKHNICGFTL